MAGMLAVFAILIGPARATPPEARFEVHYSPEERLDQIDAALIATARTTIDLASYSLTDPIFIGVAHRLSQFLDIGRERAG